MLLNKLSLLAGAGTEIGFAAEKYRRCFYANKGYRQGARVALACAGNFSGESGICSRKKRGEIFCRGKLPQAPEAGPAKRASLRVRFT
jgi:hypothetical protein